MAGSHGSSASIGDLWNKVKGMSVTVDCRNPNAPARSRSALIEQYNRRPSIYEEQDIVKGCLNLPGSIATSLSGCLQAPRASDKSDDLESGRASGAPRSAFCDALDVSAYNVIQRAVCYAGAGLGLVGVGIVTLFGLCTAAGAACTVTVCNKAAEGQCQGPDHDPRGSEVLYDGRPVVDVYNSYSPTHGNSQLPMYNIAPVQQSFYPHQYV